MDYQRTSINMVQVVRNIIGSYKMGPIRALAQDPVQNSLDAKNESKVCVEYRLHKRGRHYLLTVTDTGTTGLRGPILTAEQIEKQGSKLTQEENWAAFEGQGYTKEGEDALGSRGQGKAAFLYHSEPPEHPASRAQRMIMLYDTLLAGGEYRLGERYASPADRTKIPRIGDDARIEVQSSAYQVGEDLEIPLKLDPLNRIGTRVIVPFLSKEAIKAIKSGELSRWLQRCWWRSIQVGNLDVRVVDEKGTITEIEAPKWWVNEPWRKHLPSENPLVKENVPIVGNKDFAIKRIVLIHSPDWDEDEITSTSKTPEYSGVQLLRGGQWIETLGSREEFLDEVPLDQRSGFRGFVEFERALDKELRKKEHETPEHDNFKRQTVLVKSIIKTVENSVREFSSTMGWDTEQEQEIPPPNKEIEFAEKFVSKFMSASKKRGSRGGASGEWWTCRLHVDYPQSGLARVDWGKSLSNIYADVKVEAKEYLPSVQVKLYLITNDGKEILVQTATTQNTSFDNSGKAQFDNVKFVCGKLGKGQVQAATPGKYFLLAKVLYEGEAVAQSKATVFVAENPPESPPISPYMLGITADNITHDGRHRINSGDEVLIRVRAINRTSTPGDFKLNLVLGEHQLMDEEPFTVPGVAKGNVPESVEVASIRRRLIKSGTPGAGDIRLEAKRHYIRGDMLDESNETVAHGQQIIYFEVNPAKTQSGMPFEVKRRESGDPHPMWELVEEDNGDCLYYSPQNPLYREIRDARRRQGTLLAGKNAFIAEICANGILEWACRNDSNFQNFMNSSELDFDPHQQDQFRLYLEKIKSNGPAYGDEWRKAVAIMLYAFEKLGG